MKRTGTSFFFLLFLLIMSYYPWMMRRKRKRRGTKFLVLSLADSPLSARRRRKGLIRTGSRQAHKLICDHTVICGAAFLFPFLFSFLRPGPPIGAAKRWIPIQSRSEEREKRKCTRAHAFLCSLSFAAAQVHRCLCWRAK